MCGYSYFWSALEAQLAASQSERQALLERCCANTSETENLHKTITDLRRRLEESQAALHELGRENQTLQVIVYRYIFHALLKTHLVIILGAQMCVLYL